MEHEDRELAGAARSAHVLHITPKLSAESARLLQSALNRPSLSGPVSQVVIVGDREGAYELAAFARSIGSALAPLTVSSRASRLLERNPSAIVGTPSDLLALVRSSTLKLENVRHVVLHWADALLANEQRTADLETFLNEMPRDADRTLFIEHATAQVETFIERMALKPRRLTHENAATVAARPVHYVVVAAEQRASALQRLLDARDITNVAVVADDDRASADAAAAILALGMDVPDDVRVLGAQEVSDAALVVWYGVPASLERISALTTQAGESSEIVVLATPRDLQSLRTLAGASITLAPATLPQAADEAAQRQRQLRDELSTLLRRDPVDAELIAIEPLLAEHDAAEVAAAALRLLGRARQAAARVERPEAAQVAQRSSPTPAAAEQQWTRLFLSIGERDGAKRGDLVGAITGEAEITGAQIGKIEMRDTFSLVDVATPVADKVVERLTGVAIRGRRVTARPDRAGGRAGPADTRRGPPRRGDGDTSDRPRGGPRAAREHEEWSTRGERLRHARRPPAGGGER